MTDPPASGSFDHDEWRLNQSGDDPACARFASAHESHHKQLQDSTSYGAVARVFHSLAKATGEKRYRDLAKRLTLASELIQEAFASWSPAMALGWSRARLTATYPTYQRHYDAMDRIVADISSPYLRFHAAHATARASMQTTAIERVLDVGVPRFSFADLRARELPDSRFTHVIRNPPRWEMIDLEDGDERLSALLDAPTLTADMFDPSFEAVWNQVNEAAFAVVAAAIEGETLTVNGHLERTPGLVEAARTVAPIIDVSPGIAIRQKEARAVVLENVESEIFSVAGPLSARLLPADTDPASLVADVDTPHLFLTLRPTASLMANYVLGAEVEHPTEPVAAFLRRTVVEGDGQRVVELLRVPDPLGLLERSDTPVVAALACSVLTAEPLSRWINGERHRSTVLLLDLPLVSHLDTWLTSPDVRFRYTFLRVESFGRVVPWMVGRFEHPESEPFPLKLRPLSHAGVGVHRAALAELYIDDPRVAEDASFLAEHDGPLALALAHLAGEEVQFGTRWAALG